MALTSPIYAGKDAISNRSTVGSTCLVLSLCLVDRLGIPCYRRFSNPRVEHHTTSQGLLESFVGTVFQDHARRWSVSDNGAGFDLDRAADGEGHGLASMRLRADRIGGTGSITSGPLQRTKVTVIVPRGSAPRLTTLIRSRRGH